MLVEERAIAEEIVAAERTAPARVPAVSVLVAVRNCASYLPLALESLAAQSFEDLEIIVVDNGSSDETPYILRAWSRREPRLRTFRVARPGLARCLNFAASKARAPLLARLDADDIALPNRLAAQIEAMDARPALALLGSAAELIDSQGRRIGAIDRPVGDSELRAFQRDGCGFVHSSVMMRREAFAAAGGYRKGLNLAEDYDLWLRIAERGEIGNLPDRLVRYRMHAESATALKPVRLAVATACVVAAGEARRRGLPEPFSRGVPDLRKALPLIAMRRDGFRRDLRMDALRLVVSRYYLALPLPSVLKTALRGGAIRLGLRPLYLLFLRSALAVARSRR